jgi:UDP-N-acetylmuramoylalanine--D-glutamate ligase
VYVNDSKATNVDAALKALTAYDGGIHLILGGSLKGCSFQSLAREIAGGGKVKETLLIGEAAGEIGSSLKGSDAQVTMAGELESAVRLAQEHAEPGDVVLLAPACASFDQYRNFEQRGEHFISLVNALKQETGETQDR